MRNKDQSIIPASHLDLLATTALANIATIGPDGAPQVNPVWFDWDGTNLRFGQLTTTQKVRNLRRDPRLCVVAEAGNRGAAIKGVVIQGRAEFIVDPAQRRPIVGQLLDKYDPDLARLWGGRTMPPNRVLFRIAAEKVRSWGL